MHSGKGEVAIRSVTGVDNATVHTRIAEVLEGRSANYLLPFFWHHGEDQARLREGDGSHSRVRHRRGVRRVPPSPRFPRPALVGRYGYRHGRSPPPRHARPALRCCRRSKRAAGSDQNRYRE